MTEWLPIETAPKDGRSVLLYQDGSIETGFWYVGSLYQHWECFKGIMDPTHWMPLPKPPTEQKPPPDEGGG